jgi:hypothetical protein
LAGDAVAQASTRSATPVTRIEKITAERTLVLREAKHMARCALP